MTLLPLALSPVAIAPGIMLLPGRAHDGLLDAADAILGRVPVRHYMTPFGHAMSAALASCGSWGWTSDRSGYRYADRDPVTGETWPPIPPLLAEFAREAAGEAGFADYRPDSCLINVYEPDAKMGLHQDRNEEDLAQPIVSLSFGRSARFRIGGLSRRGPTSAVTLDHGDVIVFGGPARLIYHGIDRLIGPAHPRLGLRRINLTFRQVRRAGRCGGPAGAAGNASAGHRVIADLDDLDRVDPVGCA